MMMLAASCTVVAPMSRVSSGASACATHCVAPFAGRNARSNAAFSGRTGHHAAVAGFHAAPHRSGALPPRGRAAGKMGVVCAVRSSSPSRRGEKAQLKTGKDGRGKTVAPSAVSPPDAEVASHAAVDEASVFDELSAKVAQLQAALAEVDNVGVMDPENLARLEEGYLRGSYDGADEDLLRSGSLFSEGETDGAEGDGNMSDDDGGGDKKKASATGRKTTRSASSAAGSTTGVGSAARKPRRRLKGTKARVSARNPADDGGAADAMAESAVAGIDDARMTHTGNVVRRGGTRPRVGGGKQTDSMKAYLKEIGTVSLLTGDQEVELAKRIQDLVYLEGVRETLVEELSAEPTTFDWACAANVSESELEARLEEGKRAKNQMIQANLRLVVSIAKRYANKSMSFQDLIQEGCVGLIRGAEKFDFKRGYKFSTYAHWWIRQAVTRSISDQSRTIRLPVHLFEIISRMSKVERQMVMKLGRDPTVEELAGALDMSVEKINQIRKAGLLPISLNQTLNDDDNRTVEETLVDDHAEHPDDATGKVLLKEDLENVLNTLNPRERDVLRLRYGLDDGRIKTLEEIGNVFSVTRERIRQIEAKALRKLRQPSRNGILREYLPSEHEAHVETA